eukprot:g11629.t1
MTGPFPFSAIVGQDEMKRALMIAAVDPHVGGVLVFGDRGTGKSTTVRALAALLPKIRVVEGCPYGCDPARLAGLCPRCETPAKPAKKAGTAPAKPKSRLVPAPVIDLPLGATEDRVHGHGAAGAGQIDRRGQPADAGADDDYRRAGHGRAEWIGRTVARMPISIDQRAAAV